MDRLLELYNALIANASMSNFIDYDYDTDAAPTSWNVSTGAAVSSSDSAESKTAPYLVKMIDALFGEASLQPPIVKITRDGIADTLSDLSAATASQKERISPLLLSIAGAMPLFLLGLLLVGAPLGLLAALALIIPLISLILYVTPSAAEQARSGAVSFSDILQETTLADLRRRVRLAVRRGRQADWQVGPGRGS